MKKIIITLIVLIGLVSCNTTSSNEDMQMLQSKYTTVYKINTWEYVCIDSTGRTYHVRVTSDGQIHSTIKIK